MASYKVRLDVPLVPQARNMSCWYASACMVAYFREAGPRLGLPDVWDANTGLSFGAVANLAKVEGLSVFPQPNVGRFSGADLYAALKQAGPLWCAGMWYGFGHAIVLTGVDGNKVYFNDPAPVDKGMKNKKETVDWFNKKLLWSLKNGILYRAS